MLSLSYCAPRLDSTSLLCSCALTALPRIPVLLQLPLASLMLLGHCCSPYSSAGHLAYFCFLFFCNLFCSMALQSHAISEPNQGDKTLYSWDSTLLIDSAALSSSWDWTPRGQMQLCGLISYLSDICDQPISLWSGKRGKKGNTAQWVGTGT